MTDAMGHMTLEKIRNDFDEIAPIADDGRSGDDRYDVHWLWRYTIVWDKR